MSTLPPLTPRGGITSWIINAPSCAPVSPRVPARDDVGKLFVGDATDWGSTSRADFMGAAPKERTIPYLPSPRSNLLGDDFGEAFDRFSCTSHRSHAPPGFSPREVRKTYSNAPSESDHPLFGLHDPFRKERLGPMIDRTLYSDNYMPPNKTSYVYSSAEPPYPDTAQHSFNFGMRISHQSEQQSKYQWPAWTVPRKGVRRLNQLTIE